MSLLKPKAAKPGTTRNEGVRLLPPRRVAQGEQAGECVAVARERR